MKKLLQGGLLATTLLLGATTAVGAEISDTFMHNNQRLIKVEDLNIIEINGKATIDLAEIQALTNQLNLVNTNTTKGTRANPVAIGESIIYQYTDFVNGDIQLKLTLNIDFKNHNLSGIF